MNHPDGLNLPRLPKSLGRQTTSLHWWSSPRTLLRTVLMLDDTPHSIAIGAAVGMAVGFTPTVGFQMIIIVLLGLLTGRFWRFNRVAALAAVYISNPLTTVPIYWLLYKVGTVFVPGAATWERLSQILVYQSFAEWWRTVMALVVELGYPMLVGTLIVAPAVGLITYPFIRWLIQVVRRPADPVERPAARVPAGSDS